MPDEPDDEATQETPAGHTIPVPKRRDVFGALRKAARGGKANGADHKGDRPGD